jgi:hypothetical protein
MAITKQYVIQGNTKQAVAANQALDKSINQIDNSTKQLDNSLQKIDPTTEQAIKLADARVKRLNGTISVLGGTVATAVGALGFLGIEDEQLKSFQQGAASIIAFTSGIRDLIDGFKDINEARQAFKEIQKTATALEAADTVATSANTAAQTANTVAVAANASATTAQATATAASTTARVTEIGLIKGQSIVAKALNVVIGTLNKTLSLGAQAGRAAAVSTQAYAAGIASLLGPAGISAAAAAITVGALALRDFFKANEQATREIENLKNLNLEANKIFAQQSTELKTLQAIVNDLSLSEGTRRDALLKLKELIPDITVKDLKRKGALEQLNKEIEKEISLIEKRARIQAAETKLQETFQRQLEVQSEIARLEEGRLTAGERIAFKTVKSLTSVLRNYKTELSDLKKDQEFYTKFITDTVEPGVITVNKSIQASTKSVQEQIDALLKLNLGYEETIKRVRAIKDVSDDDITKVIEYFSDLAAEVAELDRIMYDLVFGVKDFGTITAEELEELTDLWAELNGEAERYNFLNEEQLDILRRIRNRNKGELFNRLEDLRIQYEDELKLFANNEEFKSQLTDEYEQNRKKIRRQYALETATEIVGITSQFLGVIAEINQQSLQLQLAQAAGNQSAIDKINADALEKQKKLRIAQVLITTAESILNGFNATSTLPPPFNFIAGGILGLAYGALGAKTIQTINSTNLEGGGSTGGFNNIPSGGFGSISLPGGGGVSTAPSLGAILPGLGGGRIATPSIGTVEQEPIRAYVLSGDVSNGMQAGIALNNRRRLSGG